MRERQNFLENAVDPQADHQGRLERFDMNIGCALAHRFGDYSVDQPDDGCVVHDIKKVSRRRKIFRQAVQSDTFVQAIICGGKTRATIGFRKPVLKLRPAQGQDLQRATQRTTCLNQRRRIGAIAQTDLCHLVQFKQDYTVLLGEGVSQRRRRTHCSFAGGEVGAAGAETGGTAGRRGGSARRYFRTSSSS